MAVYSYLLENNYSDPLCIKRIKNRNKKNKDLFEMLPFNIIKINFQTKETEYNQKAKDMFKVDFIEINTNF